MNNLMTNLLGKATSTTETFSSVSGLPNKRIAIQRLRATGLHANSAVKLYQTQAHLGVRLPAAVTAVDTTVKVPVDAAGGHIVKGHTLTSSDFLLIPVTAKYPSYSIKAISKVADNAGEMYCTATIVATGLALDANTPVWVVRAADVETITVGAASIDKEGPVSAIGVGCPFCMGVASGDATVTTAVAVIEYQDAV